MNDARIIGAVWIVGSFVVSTLSTSLYHIVWAVIALVWGSYLMISKP